MVKNYISVSFLPIHLCYQVPGLPSSRAVKIEGDGPALEELVFWWALLLAEMVHVATKST